MSNLLVVDDDHDLALILAEVLRDRGHVVRVAFNGEQGLAELDRQHPDLVVLDVEMPLLHGPGMALAMLLRNCGLESVPIVLVSGVVGLEQVAERVGTRYFVPKPYDTATIVAMVDRALSERSPPTPRSLRSD